MIRTGDGQVRVIWNRRQGPGPVTAFAAADGLDTYDIRCGSCRRHFKCHEARLGVIIADLVYASVYEPCEGRSQWAFAYICPWCHLGHLGRAKTETDVTGPRRSRCGRLVVVRAARVYRSRSGAAA